MIVHVRFIEFLMQAKLCGTTLRQMQTSTRQSSILQPRLAVCAPGVEATQ